MLGYPSENRDSLSDFINEIARTHSYDLELRLNLIIDIRVGLDTIIHSEDVNGQRNWLDIQHKKFNHITGKSLLTSGQIEDLFVLAYFMRDRVR